MHRSSDARPLRQRHVRVGGRAAAGRPRRAGDAASAPASPNSRRFSQAPTRSIARPRLARAARVWGLFKPALCNLRAIVDPGTGRIQRQRGLRYRRHDGGGWQAAATGSHRLPAGTSSAACANLPPLQRMPAGTAPALPELPWHLPPPAPAPPSPNHTGLRGSLHGGEGGADAAAAHAGAGVAQGHRAAQPRPCGGAWEAGLLGTGTCRAAGVRLVAAAQAGWQLRVGNVERHTSAGAHRQGRSTTSRAMRRCPPAAGAGGGAGGGAGRARRAAAAPRQPLRRHAAHAGGRRGVAGAARGASLALAARPAPGCSMPH